LDTFKSFEMLLPTINAKTFDDIALRLFTFQARENTLYKTYLKALRIEPEKITRIEEIPFLPIQFFKNHLIKTGDWNEEIIFTSSGTTGLQTSRHAVHSVAAYYANAQQIFESAFGSLQDYHLLALLPSYLERKNSSLVAMISHFIEQTKSSFSGFYLHDQQKLVKDVAQLKRGGRKIIVWGVTYALLDVAENFSPDWSGCLVFETGGMKGKRPEITRDNLHTTLKSKLHVDNVYSEYGMTELLSQAYTNGENLFVPANTMKIVVRDVGDPFKKGLLSETGGINVIDLANSRSITFIETEDLGKIHKNGLFEVLGRMDNTDSRGCNLLVE
jgi:Acyl-protein synthetase, LuxE